MATRHAPQRRRKKKKDVSPKVIFAGIVFAVLAVAAVLLAANCQHNTREKVQNISYPRSYSDYVNASALKYNLNPALVFAVIRTESGFEPTAGSSAGACGLMQITHDTFDHYRSLRDEENVYSDNDIFDPAVNIDYGCNILRDHLDTFGNEECAVAAYNAGPGNVENWLQDPHISTDGKTLIVENIPFDETRDYVDKVEDAKEMYIKLYYS